MFSFILIRSLDFFMKKQAKQENGNIKREYSKTRERFEIISNYHLLDKRLTMAEKGFFTSLLILPNKWKITQRATAKYININTETFNKYIKKLTDLGYIEIKKDKKNNADYIIKDKPTKADFDIKYINDYTVKQLNIFLNDARIEQRYKDLIKKALNGAIETSEHFENTIKEIEQETANETTETDELPF